MSKRAINVFCAILVGTFVMSRMYPLRNFVLDASCVQTIVGALMYRPTAGPMISDIYRAWDNSISTQLDPAELELSTDNFISTQLDPAELELSTEYLDSCAILRMIEPDEAQALHCHLDNYNNEIRTYLQAIVNEAKKKQHMISANANAVPSTQAAFIEDAQRQRYVRALERWTRATSGFFMLLACLFLWNAFSLSAAVDEPPHQDQPARLQNEDIDPESLIAIKIEEEEVVQMLTFGPFARQVIKVEDSDQV